MTELRNVSQIRSPFSLDSFVESIGIKQIRLISRKIVDRQTDGRTDRQAYMQTDMQAEIQTDRHTYIHRCGHFNSRD